MFLNAVRYLDDILHKYIRIYLYSADPIVKRKAKNPSKSLKRKSPTSSPPSGLEKNSVNSRLKNCVYLCEPVLSALVPNRVEGVEWIRGCFCVFYLRVLVAKICLKQLKK